MPNRLISRRLGIGIQSVLFLGWLSFLILATTSSASTRDALVNEGRHALVIGNAAYATAPLVNPTNDAKAVASALTKAGFKVDLKLNASQREMQDSVNEFADRLKGGGTGLFYFAGHGVQIKGRNFLIPVGSQIRREDDVPYQAVDVQQVLDKMETARNRINVVILDACRDNPFARSTRSGSGGLSQLDPPIGSLLAFATSPGSTASDGNGVNGLYTQHLLANMEKPGLSLEEVFKRVRLGVRLDSDGAQVPWENTSLEGDFYFYPAQAGGVAATLAPPPGLEHIARAERGYDLLRQGQLDNAERLFRALADSSQSEVNLMGREGLAELHLARGNPSAALASTAEIIAKSPARSAAYLIRARALAAVGESGGSQSAVQQAAGSRTAADFSWQKSNALVAAGNLQRKSDPQAAARAYQQAARENPKSIEALSNLAVTLKESGDPQRAVTVLEKAQALDPGDAMTVALLRQAREAIAEGQDRARQQYVDDAVKELSARFRSPPPRPVSAGQADDWTSPVMALTVLPFRDESTAVLSGRAGYEGVLQQELIRELQGLGYTVVERAVLEKVLAEVKLGSSELADQDTQIRLGRILAARLMVTGSLQSQGQAMSVASRAIDTETTRLAMLRSEKGVTVNDPASVARAIAQGVAQTVQEKYPLKGRIVSLDGDRAIINLGKKHGVASGNSFNVILRGEPIELNGRVLGYREERIGRLTVTEVDELLAYVSVAEVKAPLQKNQRIIARKP